MEEVFDDSEVAEVDDACDDSSSPVVVAVDEEARVDEARVEEPRVDDALKPPRAPAPTPLSSTTMRLVVPVRAAEGIGAELASEGASPISTALSSRALSFLPAVFQ